MPRSNVSSYASFLRHFSLAVDGLRTPLSRFLEGRSVHPPPEAMMHFPHVSDFPPIFEKNFILLENFPDFAFSRQIFRYSSAKISYDLFLVMDHKFLIPPIFPVSQYISP